MPTVRLAADELAAKEMEGNHIMISRPGEGDPQSDLFDCWGVCVGSHGGYAKTLKAAMRRCLECCGIGASWRRDYGEGPLLRDYFKEIADRHLGGWAGKR